MFVLALADVVGFGAPQDGLTVQEDLETVSAVRVKELDLENSQIEHIFGEND